MANFTGPDVCGPDGMSGGFKTPSPALCPRCNDYGKASFPIFVEIKAGTPMVHVCNSIVCLTCHEGNKKGRLIGLFTGDYAKPDFACRGAKLPDGLLLSDLQRELLEHPTRRWFTYNELIANRGTKNA